MKYVGEWKNGSPDGNGTYVALNGDMYIGLFRYALEYSTVQYSTVQYSTVQYSTVQYSTVQYSTV